ncbi:kinase-like domain-containing protein [Glomus cerebriforme]|uniref:Kinase-like domain-containing protein n=1 Tax=Glomus cerebriforme TaxID=658196 RepID=A0A397SPA4_9GLOM|nr:kinase-like domain-containing protein [Glomus cerebriforme]
MDLCEECNQKNTGLLWCNACSAKQFQQNFENWTSGNNDIDKFIQNTQLSTEESYKVLEWIPYDRFYNIKYIAQGGFSKIYKAKWIDGFITEWDNKNKKWKRWGNMDVALKSLNNSKDVTLNFINEVTLHHKVSGYIIGLYGITQDPNTKNYIMVLDYAENGTLRNYLNKSYDMLNWEDKIGNLLNIAVGLNEIHMNELIHRDLHIGNILHNKHYACISDMGLCIPAAIHRDSHIGNKHYTCISERLCKPAALENTKKNFYGVLPYVAPEILQSQNYTKAADIYSFGIIMYEVISGLPPYYNLSYNDLAIKICKGLRPSFNIKVPQLIVHLIKRCLDANPLNRPSALEVKDILYLWYYKSNYQTEIKKQIREADEINNKLQTINISSTSLSYEIHSGTIYTSRLLNFNNKNSDDYYEQYDNTISIEYSRNSTN